MIDTHCHLTFEALLERVDEVLERARGRGVDRMITVGTSPRDWSDAAALTQRYENVFATVGVHPHEAEHCQDKAAVQAGIRSFVSRPRVVAFGEMGLDRHYPDPPMDMQRELFSWQLELIAELSHTAGGLNLPVIIHNREATQEVLGMIRASGLPGERFVFHCFTGRDEELDAILELGAMVSFTGIVTFGNAKGLAASAARVPLERMMIETDSPYLTPQPHRKVRPNEPCYVADIAAFLAERRGMALGAFVEAMDANAERFFHLAQAKVQG